MIEFKEGVKHIVKGEYNFIPYWSNFLSHRYYVLWKVRKDTGMVHFMRNFTYVRDIDDSNLITTPGVCTEIVSKSNNVVAHVIAIKPAPSKWLELSTLAHELQHSVLSALAVRSFPPVVADDIQTTEVHACAITEIFSVCAQAMLDPKFPTEHITV